MKTKIKIIIAIILVLATILASNLGQLFLSNEQFIKKDNNTTQNNNH